SRIWIELQKWDKTGLASWLGRVLARTGQGLWDEATYMYMMMNIITLSTYGMDYIMLYVSFKPTRLHPRAHHISLMGFDFLLRLSPYAAD
ncbi:hypothetical protein E4U43_005194, partial [Claviceps pusilla]